LWCPDQHASAGQSWAISSSDSLLACFGSDVQTSCVSRVTVKLGWVHQLKPARKRQTCPCWSGHVTHKGRWRACGAVSAKGVVESSRSCTCRRQPCQWVLKTTKKPRPSMTGRHWADHSFTGGPRVCAVALGSSGLEHRAIRLKQHRAARSRTDLRHSTMPAPTSKRPFPERC
jgi:hypothetical protein